MQIQTVTGDLMKEIFLVCYLMLSLLLFNNKAEAGVISGGGGNSILCRDSNIPSKQTVELLDYFEVRLAGGKLTLNSNLQGYAEILTDLFNRWDQVAPRRMGLYKSWLKEFPMEAGIYSDITIPDIPDTGNIAIPAGCELKPAAFQRPDDQILPGVKRYTIDKNIWDFMPEVQKAGLVLHEFIYRESMKVGHTTSFPTRYFNGYLSSSVPKAENYTSIVSHLPLEWAEYGGGMVLKLGATAAETGGPFVFYFPLDGDGYFQDLNVSAKDLLNVKQITGNVTSKNLNIDVGSYRNSGGYFGFTPTLLELGFQAWNGFQSLHANFREASLGLINPSQDLTDLRVSVSDRCLDVQFASFQGDYPDRIEFDPKTSWITNSDGQRITGIKFLTRTSVDGATKFYQGDITTVDGDVWKRDPTASPYCTYRK